MLNVVPPGVASFLDELEMLRAAIEAGDVMLKGIRADVGLTVVNVSMNVFCLLLCIGRVVAYLGRPMLPSISWRRTWRCEHSDVWLTLSMGVSNAVLKSGEW